MGIQKNSEERSLTFVCLMKLMDGFRFTIGWIGITGLAKLCQGLNSRPQMAQPSGDMRQISLRQINLSFGLSAFPPPANSGHTLEKNFKRWSSSSAVSI